MTNIFNNFLHAPNVHTGGGLVLLRTLLITWPKDKTLIAFLDERARNKLLLSPGVQVTWVAPRLAPRIAAEWSLFRTAKTGDQILCFHGLPPLLPSAATVSVFLQNRLLVQTSISNSYKLKTRIRLNAERLLAKAFRRRVSRYAVQTHSMRREVESWLADITPKNQPQIVVKPFLAKQFVIATNACSNKTWDFIYVADGEAHKNHSTLLAAWELLAQENIRPSLALTLGPRDERITQQILSLSVSAGLKIANLGLMPHEQILDLYTNARALIFPSLTESFGLPLIEASHAGLTIIAAELDFVRDVCSPAQTFDPNSPVSIARAVKRFLKIPEERHRIGSATEFLQEFLLNETEKNSSYLP